MKALTKLAALLAFFCFAVSAGAKDYYARDFGAKPDGATLNTVSLQAAIDFVSANGGGRLVLDQGDYVTGTIYLKSDVTLHIEKGSRILGSLNPYDYIRDKDAKWTATIFAIGQKNVGVTGEGTIDGRGFLVATRYVDYVHMGLMEDNLVNDRILEDRRPENIHFLLCENVVIQDITLKDSGSWTHQYDQCKNVLVERVKVNAMSYWNNDGIDIVDCSDVIIRDCYFDAADDVYCFKSHRKGGVTENVLVENCVGRSSANGIKFGTASWGKFRNFVFKNVTIFDTYRSAFTLATVDGGQIENVTLDGLKSLHTGNVVFLRTGTRNEHDDFEPYLKDITIKNVYAEVPFEKPDAGYGYEGPVEDLPRNVCPSIIAGLPNIRIQNINFENIEIVQPGKADPEYAYCGTTDAELDSIPELEKRYPEFSNWKELPAWGFYVRHVDGISFKNVKLTVADVDYRPAFVFDDVTGIVMDNVTIVDDTAAKGKKQIVTKDVKGFKKKAVTGAVKK